MCRARRCTLCDKRNSPCRLFRGTVRIFEAQFVTEVVYNFTWCATRQWYIHKPGLFERRTVSLTGLKSVKTIHVTDLIYFVPMLMVSEGRNTMCTGSPSFLWSNFVSIFCRRKWEKCVVPLTWVSKYFINKLWLKSEVCCFVRIRLSVQLIIKTIA